MKKMTIRNGFTLVELVIVVLILGILAAVAAPKLINTSATATDNGVRVTLGTIRNAIELHAAEHGVMPGEEYVDDAGATVTQTFEQAIEPYIRGPFPACPVGSTADQDGVEIVTGTADLEASATPATGWKFNSTTGDFIINLGTPTRVDPDVNYDDF